MSASSKKKLRNAEQAEKLTEKQLKEQQEAKKLRTYTIIFAVVIALMVVFAVYTAITNTIKGSGVMERKTVALTVGEHEISSAELNYYFIDSVNNFYSSYGSYAYLLGLDVTAPLDQQITDAETGTTWADDFMESAVANIQAVYALNDAAAAAGYTLSEEELANIDLTLESMEAYVLINGYPDVETYLKAMYGYGAKEDSFRKYYEMTALAESYQNYYAENLTYEDADLRAEEAENYLAYSSFSYNSYYLSTSKFLTGGTTDENGSTTYSDEEKEAARKAAEEAAKSLTECKSVEELDSAIAALSINAEVENAASTEYTDTAYASVNTVFADWVTAEEREPGAITYIPSTTTSTDENGNEVTTTNGYYVVLFKERNDNEFALANVRHILVAFEGGSYDSTTGLTTYTDDEKQAAKVEAEQILADWQAGDATEDSFAALANEKSADSDGTDGGLYEDIYPGQMVTNFNDWCFDDTREPGNTGIVESEYGYHVMFYSGDSETTYRDFLITNALTTRDANAWYDALVEAMPAEVENTKYIATDLVLSGY